MKQIKSITIPPGYEFIGDENYVLKPQDIIWFGGYGTSSVKYMYEKAGGYVNRTVGFAIQTGGYRMAARKVKVIPSKIFDSDKPYPHGF